MHVFFLISPSFLLRGNIVAAEVWRNIHVSRALNQPLTCLWNRKLHRISFAVMVGHAAGCATQELDHCIVAEVEFVCLPQVHYTSQGHNVRHASLVSSQAQCQLTTGGVSHNYEVLGIEVALLRILHEKLVRRTNIAECTGPSPAIVTNSPVFDIGRSKAL